MGKLVLSRRSFLKVSAATAAAAAFAGSTMTGLAAADDGWSSGSAKRIRTACRGCGKMECGVWVTVDNGKAIRVEADESAFQAMGNCCTKSQSSIQAAYHPDRLRYPMKRTNPKGETAGWVRIGWDEAFQSTVNGIKTVTAKYGGESFFAMAGTSRIYCMTTYGGGWGKICNSPNTMVAFQVCKGPRHFGTELVSAFAHSWMATCDRPLVYVAWGGGSEISNYDDSCRTTVDAAYKADYHISVDPRMSNLGKEAAIWQHLRPGTDAALALSWAHVIIQNELYDDLYVKRWTTGPFLYCKDIVASGYQTGIRGQFQMKTKLLKESDILEGGSPYRFMVWDELAGTDDAHPLHTNDPSGHLTYWDANPASAHWEGEDWKPVTTGYEAKQKHLVKGVAQGWVADCSPFNPDIDPALYGKFDVVLKDGRTVKAVPTWQLYADRAAEYSPDKAEKICNIPAAEIELAAKTYASRIDPSTGYGNGGIQYMLAIEHYGNAIQNVRAIDALTGITGNFDTPAGNRGPTRSPVGITNMSGVNAAPNVTPEQNAKICGIERFPLLQWWGGTWADCTSLWDAVETGKPYQVACCINQSGDHMNMSNAVNAWEQMAKLEWNTTLDLWHAPASELADVVMPIQHWMEVECGRNSQGSHGAMGAHIKCIDMPADVKTDSECVTGIYKAAGIPRWNGPDPWPSDDVIREGEVVGGRWRNWAEYRADFIEHGWFDAKKECPEDWGTYRRYETGVLRVHPYGWTGGPAYAFTGGFKPSPGFNTPTMKHEIWSTVMESFYPNGEWNLPTFTEPPESPVSAPETYKEYPFTAMTGRRIPVYFHNEHRQLPWCRELWPAPRIEMNPADAARLGFKQGEWVWVESKRGKIRDVVDLYYGCPVGCVNLDHQWWFPELKKASHGFEHSNPNCLVDAHFQCPHCGASNVRGYAVKVYKATPENSPFGNPCPCDEDGTPIISDASDPRLKEWKAKIDINQANGNQGVE